MIELVCWSFVLAFTPIVLLITWRILDAAVSLASWSAIVSPPYFPTAQTALSTVRTGFSSRTAPAMLTESVHELESIDVRARLPLAPINDERAYRRALAVLDRLYSLDKVQTPAEREYFVALAQVAAEYECRSAASVGRS
jgi:hypothetical protein